MIRQIVTGHQGGKAVVISDSTPARTHAFEHFPGMVWSFAWTTPVHPLTSAANEAESVTPETTVIPALGETRLMFMRVPPDSVALSEGFDPAAAGAEMFEHQPDMVATFEPDDPRFHRTDSIDYVIVMEGEIHLELDDGQEVALAQHDVVIQGGTRHAWRNKSDRTAMLAIVLVGAEREDG